MHEPTAPARGAILSPESIAQAVYDAIRHCAVTLRPDYREALEEARAAADDDSPLGARAARVLGQIAENARIGAADQVPICQDTGTVWACLEAGPDVMVPGDAFRLVDDAVARAYRDGALRMSVVRDALLDRANTNTNAPAFCEVRLVPEPGARLHVLLKGGGSDNASRVVMLAPGAGPEGVIDVVLDCVREKAANACPPLVGPAPPTTRCCGPWAASPRAPSPPYSRMRPGSASTPSASGRRPSAARPRPWPCTWRRRPATSRRCPWP